MRPLDGGAVELTVWRMAKLHEFNALSPTPVGTDWETFVCEKCKLTFEAKGNTQSGHHDEPEDVRCEECHAVIGTIRCDYGIASIRQVRPKT